MTKQKKYYETNKIKILSRERKLYNENNENKERKLKRNYNYSIKNKEKRNIRFKKRKSEDKLFALTNKIRSAIHSSFRRSTFKKNSKISQILQCSFEEFKTHIEKQFESWMTWDNHGLYNINKLTWQLDHIIPTSSAKTEDELIKSNKI